MKAEERTISGILTEQIQYEIPPYQRPYSWGRDNVQELLDDIWNAYEARDSEYFIGSLITIEKTKGCLYDVVDGQQRLTTLSLIFACLRDEIADAAAKATLGSRILPCNPLTGEAETPRLTLRKKDQGFFRRHVLEGQPVTPAVAACLEPPQLRLWENLRTVAAFCAGKSEQILKLLANYILTKVYVVFVTTDSWRSAYRLFNVLNARGLSLSNADLIKNTLFSALGTETARGEELEESWLELEGIVGIDRLDPFFGHHRTSIVAARPTRALYEEVEPLIRDAMGGPFAFLDQVITSARNYMRITDADLSDTRSLRSLHALKRVEYDEWVPPLLAYLNGPVDGFPEAEFVTLLEKITMQNWVRRLGRTARLTVYYQLISAIRDGKDADSVRGIFRNAANNAEFLELLGGEVYGKPFDAAVLLRLEEAMQDESVTKSYDGRMTIEHVLPQALKDSYWQSRFSDEEHRLWVHRLGNLAPLAGYKNYKAQYYDFDRKKQIYNERQQQVSFDLTKEVVSKEEWTLEAIKERQARLINLARRTWSMH